jgi:cyclic pyranopterin phosphate synthase
MHETAASVRLGGRSFKQFIKNVFCSIIMILIGLKSTNIRNKFIRWNLITYSTLHGASEGSQPLTHIDSDGLPNMVDVSSKCSTLRTAHARCNVSLPLSLASLFDSAEKDADVRNAKGPVLATAIVAGVMAAKRTAELIPMCHGISMDDCNISIKYLKSPAAHLRIDCIARCWGRTGVEMEAMVGATTAALCVYDMCKAISHDIIISDVQLMSKSGGKRNFIRPVN